MPNFCLASRPHTFNNIVNIPWIDNINERVCVKYWRIDGFPAFRKPIRDIDNSIELVRPAESEKVNN